MMQMEAEMVDLCHAEASDCSPHWLRKSSSVSVAADEEHLADRSRYVDATIVPHVESLLQVSCGQYAKSIISTSSTFNSELVSHSSGKILLALSPSLSSPTWDLRGSTSKHVRCWAPASEPELLVDCEH